MKKYLLLSLTFLLLFASCKKNEPEQTPGLADDIAKAKTVIGKTCDDFESYLTGRGYKKSGESDDSYHKFIGEYCVVGIDLAGSDISFVEFSKQSTSLDDMKELHKVAHEQIFKGVYIAFVLGKEYQTPNEYMSRVDKLSKSECDSYEDYTKASELTYDDTDILALENSIRADPVLPDTYKWACLISNPM